MNRQIYVCSPYRGNVEENKKTAIEMCKRILSYGDIPICVHLFLDSIVGTTNQIKIMDRCLDYLHKCDILFVNAQVILTDGMKQEILYALKNNIEVRFYNG